MLPSVAVDKRAVADFGAENAPLQRFLEAISCFGPALLEVRDWSDRNTLSGLEMLPSMLSKHALCISGFGRHDVAIAAELLDAGLRVAFFEASSAEELPCSELRALPAARVGVRVPMELVCGNATATLAPMRGVAGHVLVTVRELPTVAQLQDLRTCATELRMCVALQLQSATIEQVRAYNRHGLIVSCPVMLQFRESALRNPCDPLPASLDILSAFLALLSAPASPGGPSSAGSGSAHGGVTTVVCDQAGTALGVVTSNRRSLQASLETRECVFWSRSRNRLWRKRGARIVALRADCDGVTIRCTIAAASGCGDSAGGGAGPFHFCHLGKHTCWGELSGLAKLQQHLLEKAQRTLTGGGGGGRASSYTASLFKNTELLEQRMTEQVHALAKATSKDDVASRAADVMYLLLTRCVASGVSLDDVVDKLELRALKVQRKHKQQQVEVEVEAERNTSR